MSLLIVLLDTIIQLDPKTALIFIAEIKAAVRLTEVDFFLLFVSYVHGIDLNSIISISI